jgi:hypothetical protein
MGDGIFTAAVAAVNRASWPALLVAILAGCHLGRPPAPGPGLQAGQVHAAAARPGLQPALERALAQALRESGQHSPGGWPVEVELRSASSAVVAAQGDQRVERIQLQLHFRVGGPAAGEVTRQAETLLVIRSSDPLAAESLRDQAYRELALGLCREALLWIAARPG